MTTPQPTPSPRTVSVFAHDAMVAGAHVLCTGVLARLTGGGTCSTSIGLDGPLRGAEKKLTSRVLRRRERTQLFAISQSAKERSVLRPMLKPSMFVRIIHGSKSVMP